MSHKCPCCSSSLLRHWKPNKMYWFCNYCRQEMPKFEAMEGKSYYHKQEEILTDSRVFSHELMTLNSPKKEPVIT